MPAVEKSRHVIAFATIEGILMYFIVFPIKICIVCSIKLSLERPVDIPISLSCTKLFFFQLCYCVGEVVVSVCPVLLRYDPLFGSWGEAITACPRVKPRHRLHSQHISWGMDVPMRLLERTYLERESVHACIQ